VLQAAEITAEALGTAEGEGKKLKQALDGLVLRGGESVEDAKAFAAVNHQARVLEIGQVTGDIRLRSSQHALDVAPTELAPGEQVDDAKTRRIRQALEVRFEFAHRSFHVHAYRCIDYGIPFAKKQASSLCPKKGLREGRQVDTLESQKLLKPQRLG
jgi:hypothetical protein